MFEFAKALTKYNVTEEVVLLTTIDNESLVGKRIVLDDIHIFYVLTPIRRPMFCFTEIPQVSQARTISLGTTFVINVYTLHGIELMHLCSCNRLWRSLRSSIDEDHLLKSFSSCKCLRIITRFIKKIRTDTVSNL